MSENSSKRRIYSRRGDLGETSLSFGPRVGKDHRRIVTVGIVDELNCYLGLVRTEEIAPETAEILLTIQQRLFEVGGEISTLAPQRHHIRQVTPDDIKSLELLIDQFDEPLPPLTTFIIPGGTRGAALLHVSRTIARKAERHLVALLRLDESVSRYLIGWFNRLSDLLFVLARYENEAK